MKEHKIFGLKDITHFIKGQRFDAFSKYLTVFYSKFSLLHSADKFSKEQQIFETFYNLQAKEFIANLTFKCIFFVKVQLCLSHCDLAVTS